VSKYEKKKKQLERIIKQQEDMIQGLEKAAKENQKKAELIYENYQKVGKILKKKKGKKITIEL